MSRSDGKPGTVVDESTVLDDKPERHRKRELDDLPTMSRDRYLVTNEHARGGLGVILAARDEHLGRTVAIKELAAGADDRMSTRFVREALITARLQHPGIVPVYEAGRWPTGARFYAMKMVSGKTLREELKARASLEERLALVPNVLAVAEAVGYAHSQGVIHRDLKPENVMVGAFGETVVVDWGLAKDRKLGDVAPDKSGLYVQAHAEATRIGAVIGTPAYMSPEQARGEDVDERADVWAIGAILYHLLTAAPPYSGAPDSVIERVAKDPVPRVDDQVSGAPRDLVAIVTKAMAKGPAERYANAKELAVDLSRFLTGQLVGAREYSRLAILEHWVRRHRAPVIVGAVLTAILAITATVSISRIIGERRTAQARSDELVLAQAKSQLVRDPTAALAWLKQYPARGADPESAHNIAEDAASRGIARHVWGPLPEAVNGMAISPDGKTVATASGKFLQLFDRDSGLRIGRIDIPLVAQTGPDESPGIRFLPDGKRIAGGAQDGTVFVIDNGVARAVGKIPGWPRTLDVTPDGRTIIAGGTKGDLVAFDVAGAPPRALAQFPATIVATAIVGGAAIVTGQIDKALEVRRIELADGHAETIATLALDDDLTNAVSSSDGKTLIVTVGDRVLRWDLGSDKLVEIARLRPPINAIAVAGNRIAAGGADGGIVSIVAGEPPRTLAGHVHPITSLVFSRDGRLLASGDDGGAINVWTPNGVEPKLGHRGFITALAFAPDDGLISGSDDASVRAWPALPPGRVISIGESDLFRVAWIAPSRLAVTGRRDATVAIVDLGKAPRVLARDAPTYDLDVLPNGDFATGSWDGNIRMFSADGTETHHFEHGPTQLWRVAISPDEKLLASAGSDGDVKLWAVATGEVRTLDHHAAEAKEVVFSPDGKTIVTAATDFELRVFDLATNAPPRTFKGHTGDPKSLTFSADGKMVYSAGGEGEVRGWNLATGEATVFRGHHRYVRTIALSADQRLLASGGADGLVIVWDRNDANTATILPGHTAEVRHVAFAPEGHLLASAGWDGTVRLWNLDDGRVTVWRGHEGKVHRVAFSPDGKLLASAGEDGRVRLWSLADQTAIPTDHDQLMRWLATITTATTTNAIATGLLDVVTPN